MQFLKLLPASASFFDDAAEAPANHHERVSAHAYAIWEQAGRPPGQALENWLRAEREIAVDAAHAESLRSGASGAPPPFADQ